MALRLDSRVRLRHGNEMPVLAKEEVGIPE